MTKKEKIIELLQTVPEQNINIKMSCLPQDCFWNIGKVKGDVRTTPDIVQTQYIIEFSTFKVMG